MQAPCPDSGDSEFPGVVDAAVSLTRNGLLILHDVRHLALRFLGHTK